MELDNLADRVAEEINQRAAAMSPEDRVIADQKTHEILVGLGAEKYGDD